MSKKILLMAILSGILVAGAAIFIYANYFGLAIEENQKVAVLNAKIVPLISTLKLGVYKIEGYYTSFSSSPDYVVEATISRSGDVYTFESNSSGVRGVGILEGGMLNIGFRDKFNTVGILSYRVVAEDKLEGKIAVTYFSNDRFGLSDLGREILTWQSELPARISENACGTYTDEIVTGSLIGGEVWGSQPYTGDSDFNRAAVHAGLISPGQTATIRKTSVGYLNDFSGSEANGVITSSWSKGWCGVEIDLVN